MRNLNLFQNLENHDPVSDSDNIDARSKSVIDEEGELTEKSPINKLGNLLMKDKENWSSISS